MNAVLSHWGRALNSLDVRRRNDTILRNKNVAIFILAAIGIILMIWDEEMKWSSGPQYRYGLHNNQVDVPFTVFDVLIPATNALLVWRLVDVYYFMSHLYAEQWGLQSRWTAFRVSYLRWKFLAEVLVCLVQPPPRILYQLDPVEHPWVAWARFAGLLMFLRAYMFLRLFRDFSPVFIHRHWAERQGQMPSRYVGTMLATKALLRTAPLKVMVTALVTTVVTFSYCVHVVERESRLQGVDATIDSASKAVWFVIVTLTTVGYGDTYPSTTQGYYPAILEGVWGMVLTALLVGVVISKLTLSQKEELLLDWVANQTHERAHKGHAASVVGIVVRAWLRRRTAQQREGVFSLEAAKQGALRAIGLTEDRGGHSRSIGSLHSDKSPKERTSSPGQGAVAAQRSGADEETATANALPDHPSSLGLDTEGRPVTAVRFHFALFRALKPHMKAMREFRFRTEVESDVNVYTLHTTMETVLKQQDEQKKRDQQLQASIDDLSAQVSRLLAATGAATSPPTAATSSPAVADDDSVGSGHIIGAEEAIHYNAHLQGDGDDERKG